MDRLEEIIEALKQTDEIGVAVGRDEALRIAQLLRAGAEMRSILHLMDDPRDWKPVAKAWDAALEEDA